MTYPITSIVLPATVTNTHRAWTCLVCPTPESQRSGDPYEGAALTYMGAQIELLKRQILAELGPEWVCEGVEIGGRRV